MVWSCVGGRGILSAVHGLDTSLVLGSPLFIQIPPVLNLHYLGIGRKSDLLVLVAQDYLLLALYSWK